MMNILEDTCPVGRNDPPMAAVEAIGPATLLIIEDNRDIQLALNLVLQGFGFTVKTASTPSEGLRILAATSIDLVVTDIIMPEMDGNEVARRIKKNCRSKIPVIAMTGMPSAITSDLFDATFFKPFEAISLVKKIVDLLK